jgi:PAS domain-containing protein
VYGFPPPGTQNGERMNDPAGTSSRASEQRYYHLFENMPICILVADLTVTPAVILEVKQRAELVYGYPAAELVGNPASLLVPEEARAGIQNMVQRPARRDGHNRNHQPPSGWHYFSGSRDCHPRSGR